MKSKKLTIMKTRPDISDEEIHSMMDFDGVLAKHRVAKKAVNIWKFIVPGTAVLLLTTWLLWPVEEPATPAVEPVTEKAPVQTEEIIRKPEQEQQVETKKPVETKAVKPAVTTEPAASTSQPAADVYTEAEPLNGYPDLYAYFQKELTYPVETIKDSIEGIVSVSFVINKTGKPEQIKILNSLGPAFDNEALRVIGGMPEWKPASLNGKPMPAKISMPLSFQLQRQQKP